MLARSIVTLCRGIRVRTLTTGPGPSQPPPPPTTTTTLTTSVNNNVKSNRFRYLQRTRALKPATKSTDKSNQRGLEKWIPKNSENSPISYWSHYFARRAFVRRNFVAFGLIGISLNENANELSIFSETDVKEIKLAKLRSLFSRIWYDKYPPQDYTREYNLDDLQIDQCIGKGCNAAVYEAKVKDNQEQVAVKMMFNYDAETNAPSVLRAMTMECTPFPGKFADLQIDNERVKLPEHPNIIQIKGVFTERTPLLKDAMELYPSALPARLNEESGLGKNMTLFLVMKKYDMSLREYLQKTPMPTKEVSLLLSTQMFEGVDFLINQGIAHRDLKSDNLLLDLSHKNYPRLVITDFGCAHGSLSMYYPVDVIPKGGNIAHMPPEVISAKAGPLSTIDYSTADLWASAAIAYEIWGYNNPALTWRLANQNKRRNFGQNIKQLEHMSTAPEAINKILRQIILQPSKRRPSARVTAIVCDLLLFIPEKDQEVAKFLHKDRKVDYILGCLLSRFKEWQSESETVINDLMTMLLAQVNYSDMYRAVQYF